MLSMIHRMTLDNFSLHYLFVIPLNCFQVCAPFVQAAAAKGEAPPGLPLKGAGQDSSDAQPRVKTELIFIFFYIT